MVCMKKDFDVERIEKVFRKVAAIYKSGIYCDDNIARMLSSFSEKNNRELDEYELDEVIAAAGSPNYKKFIELLEKKNIDK